MPNRFTLPEQEPDLSKDRPRIVAWAIFVALVVFVLDLNMPLGVAEAVPYVAVVLVVLRSPHRRDPLYAAVGCSVLTVVGFFLSPKGAALWLGELNRVMALFAIWATAILANQMRVANATARAKGQILSGILRNMPTVAFHIGPDGFLRESVGKGLNRIGVSGYESYGRNALEPPPEIVDAMLRSERTAPVFYESSGLNRGRPWWFWNCLIPEKIEDDEGLIGFRLDITHLKQAERRLATHQAVTQVLVQTNSIFQAYQEILQAICESLHWAIGAIWEIDPHRDVMHCIKIWHQPSLQLEAFVNQTHGLTFVSGVGLPGRVWKQGEPAWVVDVAQDPNFPRASAAQQVGLHGGFAFPIQRGSRVVSVMEFFTLEAMEPDQELLEMFSAFGKQLGQFIERKQKERRLAVHSAVAKVLIEAEHEAEAYPQILKAVCSVLDWELGLFWEWRKETQSLHCVESWHGPSPSLERVVSEARQTPLAAGVGLAGEVLKKNQPLGIDLPQHGEYPLQARLTEGGLRGGFAFPIPLGSHPLGVMEFFRSQPLDVDEELCTMFTAIGIQIGYFIGHIRSENRKNEKDESP